jgi:hypothetical protein
MQRPIRPEWLIRQADELAGRWATAGQPRNADLRRAVSSAYYALYHHLVLGAAKHLLPLCSEEDCWHLCRLFQHTAVREVFDWIARPGPPPARVAYSVKRLRANVPLRDVAIAFQQLQQARYDADYNHIADFTRPETLSLIDTAEDAISKLIAARRTDDYERLVAFLALKSKL